MSGSGSSDETINFTSETQQMVQTIMREIAYHYYPRDVLSGLLATVDLLRLDVGQDEQVFTTGRFNPMSWFQKVSTSFYAPVLVQGGEISKIDRANASITVAVTVNVDRWQIGDRVEVRKVAKA